ncbi:hypothetical protein BAE44_0023349 [Dichanthelium oligosanthes]|uniref:Pectinesterase inhibitor domain-containing protein n=1 Tax=Dichanthelium oligosanthes TaxID=888268 RepID=A0A1E5URX6_9POAL|nr:hypothetical protein BAE44_0023349 [Dichanthelium oligosanthes]
MAPMATNTTKNALVLLLLAVLPLATLSSRAGPSAHKSHDHDHHSHGHGHGPKHPSPPASFSPPPAAAPPAAANALVRATCNSTTYPDLCVSALGADPSSATADVRGLSAIAVSVAAANASGGAATAAALANGTAPEGTAAQAPSTDGAVQALLRTCAAKYGEARDALSAARDSIAEQDYDFASVHVSAAAEYPQVCKALFRRQRPGQYPAELAAREEALKQLCSVALDIIALLSNSS